MSSTATVDRGQIAVKLSCKNAPCSGEAELVKGAVVLAKASYSLGRSTERDHRAEAHSGGLENLRRREGTPAHQETGCHGPGWQQGDEDHPRVLMRRAV